MYNLADKNTLNLNVGFLCMPSQDQKTRRIGRLNGRREMSIGDVGICTHCSKSVG